MAPLSRPAKTARNAQCSGAHRHLKSPRGWSALTTTGRQCHTARTGVPDPNHGLDVDSQLRTVESASRWRLGQEHPSEQGKRVHDDKSHSPAACLAANALQTYGTSPDITGPHPTARSPVAGLASREVVGIRGGLLGWKSP